MRIVAASTAEDAEFVRVLRNASAKFWTRNQTQVSKEEQINWWETREANGYKVHIFIVGGDRVGYLLTHVEDKQGKRCIGAVSLAVVEKMRRKGIGTAIYRWAISNMKELGFTCLVADIYKTNIASLISALKAGFKITSTHFHVVRLVAT